MTEHSDWTLQDFLPKLDAWVEAEHPTDELRLLVMTRISTRIGDPFVSARRVAGFEDYWKRSCRTAITSMTMPNAAVAFASTGST